MGKLFSALLIGCLSMLFAEVFSGASQVWFVKSWGLLITFPLYTCHLLFFLWIALRIKKIAIYQLYLFGVIFALYESWITKVLWAGYINTAGPTLGTFCGVGISEFPMLVFFWHPVMSFILPILVFEILTEKVLIEHKSILKKTTKKTIAITLFLISISTFIAKGNGFSLLSSNMSLIGTLLIILILYYFTRKSSQTKGIESLKLKKSSFVLISIYLILLYLTAFFRIRPEKIPNKASPYILIIIFYIIPTVLILKSSETATESEILKGNLYSIHDLEKFTAMIILSTNIACLVPSISIVILMFTYYLFTITGTVIFVIVIYKFLNQVFIANRAPQ